MQSSRNQTSQITMWKIVVLGVCLCVFVFGLQAKLVQYQAPSPNATAVSSAKMWDGDHRMEVESLLSISVLLGLTILLVFRFILDRVLVLRPMLSIPAPVRLSSLSHLGRFFRPPPIY